MSEYLLKLNEINEKIDTLNNYTKVSGIIPSEFVNEPIIGDAKENETKPCKHFEF